ncbi:MAG TPA: TIGR03000 domain-containing protein [Gemmataceae bacterium]
MTRRLIPWAIAAVLAGPAPHAAAQYYAIRGGPIYGGPVRGGGPSLFTGAYAPQYYPFPLTGAGFGAFYMNSVPYYGGGAVAGGGSVPPTVYFAMPGVVYAPPPVTNQGGAQPPQPPYPPRSQEGVRPSEGSRSAPGEPPAPAPAPPPATGRAQFSVRLPADAKLWVNDVETKQTGPSRRFHTPANLEPGKTYEYTFRAQWTDGGQAVTRDRTQRFKAGDDLTVDFTEAAAR